MNKLDSTKQGGAGGRQPPRKACHGSMQCRAVSAKPSTENIQHNALLGSESGEDGQKMEPRRLPKSSKNVPVPLVFEMNRAN